MTLLIRTATKRDIKAWGAMRHALWPHASLAELSRELGPMLKRPRFKGWLAFDAGKPVGFAEAYVREFANGCEGQPVAFLEGIWVEPGHRRTGVGKRLIAAV